MLKTLLVVLALAAGALADSFVFFDGDEPELDDPFDLRQLTVTIVGECFVSSSRCAVPSFFATQTQLLPLLTYASCSSRLIWTTAKTLGTQRQRTMEMESPPFAAWTGPSTFRWI